MSAPELHLQLILRGQFAEERPNAWRARPFRLVVAHSPEDRLTWRQSSFVSPHLHGSSQQAKKSPSIKSTESNGQTGLSLRKARACCGSKAISRCLRAATILLRVLASVVFLKMVAGSPLPAKFQSVRPQISDRVTMQVSARGYRAMIAASVQCDVNRIPKDRNRATGNPFTVAGFHAS